MARREEAARAVALIDWVRSTKRTAPVSFQALDHELIASGVRRGAARARRALQASTELSESVGESLTRVAILRLGFEPPELQVEFADEQGSMFPDFFWRGSSVALEFDGKIKYTRQEYSAGDPVEVVWREKLREDRLRRLVRTVVRVVWQDVTDPGRLAALLSAAGVPRADHSRRTGL